MAKLTKTYNLEKINPKLAKEWHPTKNGSLTPKDFTPRSSQKAWWICENEHEWPANISDRSYGTRCPFCTGRFTTEENNLQVINPKLAEEWHPLKNGKLTPKDELPKSGKKVWWRCTNDHDWHASIISRARGKGCPSCPLKTAPAEYNLQVVNSKLAKEWHPVKNGHLTPKDVFPGSHKKVWWLCEKGHAWKAFVFSRKRGTGCPHCNRQERSLAYYHSIETGIKNKFFNL